MCLLSPFASTNDRSNPISHFRFTWHSMTSWQIYPNLFGFRKLEDSCSRLQIVSEDVGDNEIAQRARAARDARSFESQAQLLGAIDVKGK